MEKEDILLKNYSVLSKNPIKNADSLKSLISQLVGINPTLGFRCWSELLKENLEELQESFYTNEFKYKSIGYYIVKEFESAILCDSNFPNAMSEFSKNKQLLEIVYSKSPMTYVYIADVLTYLIRLERLKEADNILSAIYKNKTFSKYSKLWEQIISDFNKKGRNAYNYRGIIIGCGSDYSQPKNVTDFCMEWIQRINDEEEQAGAMTHAMRMF